MKMSLELVRASMGHVETELKERVASLEKEKVDLKVRNRELLGQVGSLEASVVRNKALVEDAKACLSCNVDLHVELKRKDEVLRKAEDSRKKAEELEENAKKLLDSCAALLAYIQEAKVAIDTAFVKGGAGGQAGCYPKLILLRFQHGFRRSLASFLNCWIMLLILGLMGLLLPLHGLSRALDVII
jgi:hypothetical protein